MFEKFFDALAEVLNFFFVLVPKGLQDTVGFGFAIMGLTVLVMIVITPLTVKSTRSMLQMQQMQPEMKRIQEKYKNDREQLNAELMAFYRENQINPLGGCLPMIAQAPVFFIMYRLIEGLTVRKGGLGSGLGQTLGNVALNNPFQPWILREQPFNPNHLDPSSPLYKALSGSSQMDFFGMDLSLSASDAIKVGLWIAIPYLALLGIMLATGLYQNRQLRLRNTSAQSNPQQQMIMKFMPFFLPIISFGFPAGMALYWCTQNLCRIGTNAYITKSVYRKEHQGDKDGDGSKGDGAKGNGARKISTKSGSDGVKANGKSGSKSGDDSRTVDSSDKSTKKKGSSTQSAPAAESPGPGTSVRSQAAHRKAVSKSDQPKAEGSKKSGPGNQYLNPRRSGESRRRSQKKD